MIRSLVTVLCGGLSLVVVGTPARAAKLVEVRTVDDETIMVYWHDAEVEWKDTGTGPTAFRGGCDSAGEVIHKFDPPLDTAAAEARLRKIREVMADRQRYIEIS